MKTKLFTIFLLSLSVFSCSSNIENQILPIENNAHTESLFSKIKGVYVEKEKDNRYPIPISRLSFIVEGVTGRVKSKIDIIKIKKPEESKVTKISSSSRYVRLGKDYKLYIENPFEYFGTEKFMYAEIGTYKKRVNLMNGGEISYQLNSPFSFKYETGEFLSFEQPEIILKKNNKSTISETDLKLVKKDFSDFI